MSITAQIIIGGFVAGYIVGFAVAVLIILYLSRPVDEDNENEINNN